LIAEGEEGREGIQCTSEKTNESVYVVYTVTTHKPSGENTLPQRLARAMKPNASAENKSYKPTPPLGNRARAARGGVTKFYYRLEHFGTSGMARKAVDQEREVEGEHNTEPELEPFLVGERQLWRALFDKIVEVMKGPHEGNHTA